MAKFARLAAIAGGVAALAAGGVAVVTYRERRTEQPDYTLVETDGAIEVRDYPDLLIADYIFAKRRGPGDDAKPDEKIAMTAPVLSDRTTRGQWRTRFVMPAGHPANDLPTPDGGVSITRLPARRMAAIRFAGSAGDDALADNERKLRVWLAQHGFSPDGPAEHAYYNSPFVPPPLRHNEVLVPVAR